MVPGAGGDVNTTLPLVLNIVAIFCFCIVGIIGLIFAIQAGTAKKNGDMETARSKAKLSLILAIVGIALGIVGGVTSFIINAANM